MRMFSDSPCGGSPPKLERTIGLAAAPVVGSAVFLWWRGRESAQDVIPEASARAQVQAAHARAEAMA
jgi:hypothetical protein